MILITLYRLFFWWSISKIEKGYYRLPGAGYAAINPELKDINPEDYSYIQRFKILSDVAVGSDEYYQYKDIMDARYANNQLTDYEKDIYLDTIDKLSKKSIAKDFYTAPEGDNGLIGSSVSKYWKMITSLSESPTESLTFLRPSAKFIHQRTAVEDYEKHKYMVAIMPCGQVHILTLSSQQLMMF